MSKELSTPAAIYIGGATAFGLASIAISVIEHKRSTARGERMAPTKGQKASPMQLAFMGLGIFVTIYQTAEVISGIQELEELKKFL